MKEKGHLMCLFVYLGLETIPTLSLIFIELNYAAYRVYTFEKMTFCA